MRFTPENRFCQHIPHVRGQGSPKAAACSLVMQPRQPTSVQWRPLQYKCELPTLHTNSCGLIGLGYCFTDVLTNSTDTICIPFAVAALFTNYHEMSRKPLRAYTPPSAGDSTLRQSLDLQ